MYLKTCLLSLSLPLVVASCGSDGDLLLPTEEVDIPEPRLEPCFDMSIDEFNVHVAPYLDGERQPEYIPLSYEVDTANDRVTVCYDYSLDVIATVGTTLVRDYSWDIDTRPAVNELTLAPGELYELPYVVDVVADPTDRNWAVSGSMLIENDSPFKAVVTGVYDGIHGISVATFCGVELPHTLRPGQSMTCQFWLKLPAAVSGVSRVIVATEGRVGPGYASTAFDFGDPLVSFWDECVRAFDGFAGPLGQVCGHSASFDLKTTVGGFDQCGQYQWGNTARIEGDEWTMRDGWSLSIDVPCENGGLDE